MDPELTPEEIEALHAEADQVQREVEEAETLPEPPDNPDVPF